MADSTFNNVIIALISIIAILNLRATWQNLATQRNEDLFQFDMSLSESLNGDSECNSDLSSDSSITTISTNSSSENSSMDTTITDDSNINITSKATSD